MHRPSDCEYAPVVLDIQPAAPAIQQYRATQILQMIAHLKRQDWERTLGVVDVDLYVPELNFVFADGSDYLVSFAGKLSYCMSQR